MLACDQLKYNNRVGPCSPPPTAVTVTDEGRIIINLLITGAWSNSLPSLIWAVQGSSSPPCFYHNSFSNQLKFSLNYCSLTSYRPLSAGHASRPHPPDTCCHQSQQLAAAMPEVLSRDTKVYFCESAHNLGRNCHSYNIDFSVVLVNQNQY